MYPPNAKALVRLHGGNATRERSLDGYLAAGVPGMVKGLLDLLATVLVRIPRRSVAPHNEARVSFAARRFGMLDHLSLGTADLARAVVFYDAALAPLGIVRVWTYDDAAGYGYPGEDDRLAIKRRPGFVAPGPGHHVALVARSRAAVDAFFQAAVAHGGADDGPPGLRTHYGPTYYAAFVVDPDGHRLEAVCHSG